MRVLFPRRPLALLALSLGLGGLALLLVVPWALRANPACSALAAELLPNAKLHDSEGDDIADGWGAAFKGPARLAAPGDFTVGGQGRSWQLIGIANSITTPTVLVQPGTSYCFVVQALADQAPAPTALQLRFGWRDTFGAPISEHRSAWLSVKTPAGGGWSLLRVAAQAPAGAAQLVVSMHPAADDRVYLDDLHLRFGGAWGERWPGVGVASAAQLPGPVTLSPWPYGKRAAVSFSFDWETTMGGLIHSRSAGDPNVDEDPIARGLRMRQGVTETLAIFRPLGVRATYYATGYNFLSGNRQRRVFMGDPTYSWATPANRWRNDWSARRWFGDDPHTDYTDVASNGAAWYFGDLLPLLLAERQDVQSHTFAHFYGGLVGPADWNADLTAWHEVAAPLGVAAPRSLAFPWSSSGGMSYASWQELEQAGITSVTRLSKQPQYQLFAYKEDVPVAPRCQPLPAHETIMACPDLYLTPGKREQQALAAIDAALAAEGAIDVWAHTEEVISAAQIATWQRVVGYAATNPKLWVAPLAEIADRQRAVAEVVVVPLVADGSAVRLFNHSSETLEGVTVRFPFAAARATVGRHDALIIDGQAVLRLAPGQSIEVQAWPA